ncbi:hypothetical protein SAMN05421678_12224 [Actinopolymorpha cephalotaxi]|uniref:Uncharacterized protein n=1 Tax=Actinopolymorpha cephalotaxi TaxID=504797 RepID=A0A1I3B572_9ACTN|nr:hypothetical protein [Actinopolymorpha cephalotaxi]NYH81237.1 hypothetical protein [Actinopolymorpha cephalotaxi]SFH57099.1 hypothetical protein SAMN05421678_12224 [Actinopolymorpha cephalotaxi]
MQASTNPGNGSSSVDESLFGSTGIKRDQVTGQQSGIGHDA